MCVILKGDCMKEIIRMILRKEPLVKIYKNYIFEHTSDFLKHKKFIVIKDFQVTNFYTGEVINLCRNDFVKKVEKLNKVNIYEFKIDDKIFHLTLNEIDNYLLSYDKRFSITVCIVKEYFNSKSFFHKLKKLKKLNYYWYGSKKLKCFKKIFYTEIFVYLQDLFVNADKIALDYFVDNIMNNLNEMQNFVDKNPNKEFCKQVIKKYGQLIQQIHLVVFEYGNNIQHIKTAKDVNDEIKNQYLSTLENINIKLDIMAQYQQPIA